MIQKGDQLKNHGKLDQAVQHYEKARRESPKSVESSEAAIREGLTRIQLVKDPKEEIKNSKEEIDKAIVSFQHAIDNGTKDQIVRASNGQANAFLAQGQHKKAIEVLEKCNATVGDAWSMANGQRYVLQYNLARAYDLDGDAAKALSGYRQAIQSNPSFTMASDRAVALVRKESAKLDIRKDVYPLGQRLITQGNSKQARDIGLEVLRGSPRSSKEADHGMALIVHSYAKTTNLAEALKNDEKMLIGVKESGYGDAVDELYKAGSSVLPVVVQRPRTRTVPGFGWFSSRERDEVVSAAFATFVIRAAQPFAAMREGVMDNPRQALARYLLAYSIGNSSDGAERAAWVLSKSFKQLDDHAQIYDQLVRTFLDEKGLLYQIRYKTKPDWENILRMHFLLGTLFESKGEWGDETKRDSAIYQWQHAVAAEAKVREFGDGKEYSAPGLHEHLGNAYLETKQPDKALTSYLTAGETYLKRGEKDKAREILMQVTKLIPAFDANQRQLIETYAKKLDH
jgi:tetratricopeptide (TPR) repeat protein